ncbi:Uncharacterised protein [uncultured archaeon]|nr:Uncharacterised protein [uncultured archaeon]
MGLIFVITTVVTILLMLIGNQIRSNTIKEQQDAQDYSVWLAENCNCLAHDRISCPTGFELQNKTCINKTQNVYTYKFLECSEYNCSGEIKLWDNQIGAWQ